MTIVKFLFYIVIFFIVSTLIQLLYNYLINKYQLQMDWVTWLMPILTIFIWIIVPSHWIILILFAATTGMIISEKDNKKVKKRKLF